MTSLQNKSDIKSLSNPWAFLTLTLTLTWSIQFPFILLGEKTLTFPYVIFFYLGSASPALVAIFMTYRTCNNQIIRCFWQRIIDVKRIHWKWWLIICLLYPLFNILSILIQSVLTHTLINFDKPLTLLTNPLQLISMAIFLFLFGPLPEEIGWRGYGLEHLQSKHSALKSSLIIGVFWALWHLPLFFIPGTYQSGLGNGSPGFWLFFIALLPDSILYTWIYNNTNRSTLSAILFHFVTNFSGEFFEPHQQALFIRFGLVIILAIFLAHNLKKSTFP